MKNIIVNLNKSHVWQNFSKRNLSFFRSSLGLNEEQIQFHEIATQFAKDKLAPIMQDMDEKESFPVEVMKEGASLGFAALYVKEKYGGMNLGRVDASVR